MREKMNKEVKELTDRLSMILAEEGKNRKIIVSSMGAEVLSVDVQEFNADGMLIGLKQVMDTAMKGGVS